MMSVPLSASCDTQRQQMDFHAEHEKHKTANSLNFTVKSRLQ